MREPQCLENPQSRQTIPAAPEASDPTQPKGRGATPAHCVTIRTPLPEHCSACDQPRREGCRSSEGSCLGSRAGAGTRWRRGSSARISRAVDLGRSPRSDGQGLPQAVGHWVFALVPAHEVVIWSSRTMWKPRFNLFGSGFGASEPDTTGEARKGPRRGPQKGQMAQSAPKGPQRGPKPERGKERRAKPPPPLPCTTLHCKAARGSVWLPKPVACHSLLAAMCTLPAWQ